jgi:hypothetical protein
MMGELSASLAHEIKQPIATARNNASAALNFLDTHQSRCVIVRGARSLRLAQRFVEALDFGAVQPLVPDLKPCAEGFGRT